MTEQDLKNMNQDELIALVRRSAALVSQLRKENKELKDQNEVLKSQVSQPVEEKKEETAAPVNPENAGSIADASIKISGVLEAAQKAADTYLEQIKQMRANAQLEADTLLKQTKDKCASLEITAKTHADEMTEKAERECKDMKEQAQKDAAEQWGIMKKRLDEYVSLKKDLLDQVDLLHSKTDQH